MVIFGGFVVYFRQQVTVVSSIDMLTPVGGSKHHTAFAE